MLLEAKRACRVGGEGAGRGGRRRGCRFYGAVRDRFSVLLALPDITMPHLVGELDALLQVAPPPSHTRCAGQCCFHQLGKYRGTRALSGFSRSAAHTTPDVQPAKVNVSALGTNVARGGGRRRDVQPPSRCRAGAGAGAGAGGDRELVGRLLARLYSVDDPVYQKVQRGVVAALRLLLLEKVGSGEASTGSQALPWAGAQHA